MLIATTIGHFDVSQRHWIEVVVCEGYESKSQATQLNHFLHNLLRMPLPGPLAIGAPTGEAGYVYNAAGQRINLVYPTGEVVTYTHDAAGRLQSVTDWDGGTTVYTYTAAGRLSGIATASSSS